GPDPRPPGSDARLAGGRAVLDGRLLRPGRRADPPRAARPGPLPPPPLRRQPAAPRRRRLARPPRPEHPRPARPGALAGPARGGRAVTLGTARGVRPDLLPRLDAGGERRPPGLHRTAGAPPLAPGLSAPQRAAGRRFAGGLIFLSAFSPADASPDRGTLRPRRRSRRGGTPAEDPAMHAEDQ